MTESHGRPAHRPRTFPAGGRDGPLPGSKGASAGTFAWALAASVVINDLLRWWLIHTRSAGAAVGAAAAGTLNGSLVLQFAVTVAFVVTAVGTLPAIRTGALPGRRLQALLGMLASAILAISLAAVLLSIYRRNEAGYELLAESLALYVAINLVFLYWYWFADHPLRSTVLQAEGDVETTYFARFDEGIRFPEEDLLEGTDHEGSWVPGITDYAYFTLLSSNCFGAPEGHVLIGRTLKLVQIVHTMFMIFVFIIIVSRAINTLG